MNKWGRGVIWVWAVLAILCLLFPPFVFRPNGGGMGSHGFGFIYKSQGPVVNVPLLTLIEAVLAAVAAGLVFSRRSEP